MSSATTVNAPADSAGAQAASVPERYSHHAFMSYSHAADDRLAPALQRALQRFAKPWWRLRALNVFRDKTSLAADPALWQAIERALAQSTWFILLASPGAANSHWVNREVEWWLRERSAARLLIVLTDGDLAWDRASGDFDARRSTAIPPALRGAFTEEPNFVDLRFARAKGNDDQRSLRHAGFRAAVLDLAAPIHGIGKDQLDGDDVRQFRRTRLIAGLAVLAMVVLTILASAAAVVAKRQSDEATRRGEVALSRQLAARSQLLLSDGRLDEALLHAVESRRALGPQALADAEMDWTDALVSTLVQPGPPLLAHLRAGGPVWASPDGRSLATHDGSHITLWDLTTSRVRQRLPARAGGVRTLAWAPDNQHLIVASKVLPEILIINTADGRAVRSTLTLPAAADQVALSPDGRWLLASGDGGLQLHDLDASGAPAVAFPGPRSGVVSMAFDKASSLVALGGGHGEAMLVRLATRQTVTSTTVPAVNGVSQLAAVALSPDGQHLVLAGPQGLVVWHVTGGRRLWANQEVGEVRSLAMHPAGDTFATGHARGTVQQWQLAPGAVGGGIGVSLPMARHQGWVQSLAYLHAGERLVSGDTDGLALLWDLTREQRLLQPLSAGRGPVRQLDVRPDGAAMATAVCLDEDADVPGASCAQSGIQVHALPKAGAAARLVERVEGLPLALRYTAGAGRLAVATCLQRADAGCSTVKIIHWDPDLQRKDETSLSPDGLVVHALALSPTGDRVAACTARPGASLDRKQLWLWPLPLAAPRLVADGAELVTCQGLSFSADGHSLAADLRGETRVWRVADGQALARFAEAFDPTFSRDGTRLALSVMGGSGQGQLQLFHVGSQLRLLPLPLGQDFEPTRVAWRADGRLLAVAGDDRSSPNKTRLVLVDVDRGRRVGAELRWSGGSVRQLQFAPGGQALLLGTEDGKVARIDLDPASWQEQACRVANRNLRLDEWTLLRGNDCYRPACPELPVEPDIATAPQRLQALGDLDGARQATQCAAGADQRWPWTGWWARR